MASKTHMGIKIDKPLETGYGESAKSTGKTQPSQSTETPPPSNTFVDNTTQTPTETTSTSPSQTQVVPEEPPKSTVKKLKNPNISGLPFQKGDSPIKPNDSGPAVKWIQDFLQTLPDVQKQQQLIAETNFSQGGIVDTLTNAKHYGNYDLDTRRYLRDYQNRNKDRIKRFGQLSNIELEKEINSSIITFATVNVILEDKGEYEVIQEAKKEPDPPPQKIESVIKDPDKAKDVPESTFFVKTKNPNHRLALRKAPAYSKVSKEANEDEDKKGERIEMMPNETLLKVIVPHVGYNCEWHQVEVVDSDSKWNGVKEIQKTQKLYAYAEFIQPRQNTPSLIAVNCEGCTEIVSGSDRKTPFPDWTKMGGCDVFYDRETASYYIVVESVHEGVTKEELPAVKKQAMFEGIMNLLDFYDRENGKDQIQRIIDIIGDTSLEQQDYFLEERPNARMKFLVSLPKKYFDAVKRRQEFFNGVATLGGIMPKEWRTTVFNYGEFKSGIDIAIKRFEEYAQEIDKFDGQVLNFDIREEAKKLQSFIPVFEKLLGWNEVVLKDDLSNQFEIGFSGPCFRLIYVLEKKDEKVSIPLRIGIECFKNTEPVSFERTMGYVFYLIEMVKDIKKEKRRWISFVNSYTCPLARIIPSGNRVGGEKRDQKKLERQLNDSPVKNTPEKQKEDEQIQDVKAKAIANRGNNDYVGDPLFSCEGSSAALTRIKDLKTLYKEVLNKVNVKDLISFVTSCLASGMTPAELNAMACDNALKSLGYDQLMKIIDFMNNNDVVNIQEKLVVLSTDPQYINTDPSIKLRLAITQGTSKNTICKAISNFDPSLMTNFLKNLLPKKPYFPTKHKAPTISLKDTLPTEDTLKEIRSTLENAVREAIYQSLFMLIQVVFKSLCNICSQNDMPLPDQNYGGDDLNDHFRKSGIDPNNLDLDDFDIPPDCDNIEDFFGDLSSFLTPDELCSLLDGTASIDLLNMIKNLLKRKYPCLSNYLRDTFKIKRMFEHLGTFIDPSLCTMIEGEAGPIPLNLCEEREDIKRNLLQGKLSNEEIDKQIQKEKDRNKELLRQLVNLSEDGSLNNFIPPITQNPCDKSGKNTAISNSIIPPNPPSMAKLNDQIVDVMFDTVEETFNRDIRGFVRSMIDVNDSFGANLNKNDYKEIYNIERKKADDLSTDEQYKRLQNPEYKKTITDVMPSLKNNLSNQNNFVKYKDTFIDFDYKLSTDASKGKDFLERNKQEANNRAQEFNKQLQDFLKKEVEVRYIKNTDESITTHFPSQGGSFSGGGTIFGEEMAQDILIRNYIQQYRGDPSKIKDYYRFKINDVEGKKQYVYDGVKDIDKNIVDSITCFKLNNEESLNQSAFAGLSQKIWLDFLKDEKDIQNKILSKGDFYKFLKNDAFADITTVLMKQISSYISQSPLFSVGNLENIDFVPDIESKDCNTQERKSLLDIESLKEKTKDKFEKELDKCPDKVDETLSQMDPMERAGTYSAIEVYIKLFVIENFLRGMFVFSKFKSADLLGDPIILDYLIKKIESELKEQSEGFYQLILKCSKDTISSRGAGITDPLSSQLEADLGSKKIIDENDPRWVSGESALEFLIKENINVVSELFDSLLNYEKENVDDIFRVFVDKWYDAIYDPPDASKDDGGSQNFKNYILSRGGKGDFIMERYIRTCGEKEEDMKVFPVNYYMDGKTKFVYGIRLCYIFSNDVNFKGSIFDIEIPKDATYNSDEYRRIERMKDTIQRERSYIFRHDKDYDKHSGQEFLDMSKIDWEYRYIYPLIFIEEDEYRFNKLDDQSLRDLINNTLKVKMINSKNFQMLFKFIFPLQRLLTLSSIYSMLASSFLIKDVDYKFANTKKILKNLLSILLPSSEPWWKKKSGIKKNEDLRQEYEGNISTNGCSPSFASIAAMTIPILVKGIAEKQDPCYGLMKKIWDVEPDALMAGLSWGSVLQFLPMNLLPLIGWGPSLLPWGMAALSMPLLPGEQKHMRKNSSKDKEKQKEKCKGGNNK